MTMLSPTFSAPHGDPPEERRLLLSGISWDTYSAILKDIGDSAVRLTYDNGQLEVELPGKHHEIVRKLCAALIERTLERLGIEYEPEGSTTWRQKAGLRGLEADECYHIQHFRNVVGRHELDLTVDPPPDLAVEVEIESPLMSKMDVYRGLKVAELWRVRSNHSCDMFRLNESGDYESIEQSLAIPVLTPAVIAQYVLLRQENSHTETLRRFDVEFLTTLPR